MYTTALGILFFGTDVINIAPNQMKNVVHQVDFPLVLF